MNNASLSPELYRVIDANLNRLKEGIRVIEDIARYSYNNQSLASRLKALRHSSQIDDLLHLLHSRDSVNDVLRPSTVSELERTDIQSIVTANYKRAQESSRVLEEMYKILSPELSEHFKHIRYELYTLEKEQTLNTTSR
jgi:hypothetical protein